MLEEWNLPSFKKEIIVLSFPTGQRESGEDVKMEYNQHRDGHEATWGLYLLFTLSFDNICNQPQSQQGHYDAHLSAHAPAIHETSPIHTAWNCQNHPPVSACSCA